MSETDKVFGGSIPENYDRYLVPLIFEDFAQDIVQRVASFSPSAVLETAAGSGVVTRALTLKLSPAASFTVTDLNQPMLDYAATRRVADACINWRKVEAQALPFEDSAFNVVFCQFGVMFFLTAKKSLKHYFQSLGLLDARFAKTLKASCVICKTKTSHLAGWRARIVAMSSAMVSRSLGKFS
jgi:SAM-dependent methyltransferase